MNPLAAVGVQHVDYKDVPRLRRFLTDMGKIEPRRKSGVSAKHQRSLALAIKRARHLALLPYVDTMRDSRGQGRRGGRPGGGRGFSRGGERGFGDRPERGDRGPAPEAAEE
jgi:ribosomal protein S18